MSHELTIRPATIDDVALIRQFIAELADYEKLSHQVVVDDEALRTHLFGPRASAEALLGFAGEEPAAVAVASSGRCSIGTSRRPSSTRG